MLKLSLLMAFIIFGNTQSWAIPQDILALEKLHELTETQQVESLKIQSAFIEFKQELKMNKKFRQLFKRGRKSPEELKSAQEEFLRFFDERAVKFGYFKTDRFTAYNLLILGFSLRGDDVRYGNSQLELGPGLGFMRGYDMIACLLDGKGINGGAAARIVVGGGVSAGLFFGQNGACINLGVGLGLNVSGGLGALFIDEEYFNLEL